MKCHNRKLHSPIRLELTTIVFPGIVSWNNAFFPGQTRRVESLYVELKLGNEMWLISCSYNLNKNVACSYLERHVGVLTAIMNRIL